MTSFLALGRAPAEQVGVARLGAEVHLVEQNGLEVFPEPSRNARRDDGERLRHDQKPVQRAQIGGNQRANAWSPHLHGHAFAGLQTRLVDASQRGGADRLGIENLEYIVERLPEIALDDRDGLLGREGRCLIEHLASSAQ